MPIHGLLVKTQCRSSPGEPRRSQGPCDGGQGAASCLQAGKAGARQHLPTAGSDTGRAEAAQRMSEAGLGKGARQARSLPARILFHLLMGEMCP